MASSTEIQERVSFESARRARLAVPAVAGGVLYLLGGIILSAALKELPAVGVVQGLEPALKGRAAPVVSPRAPEVSYINHHAFYLLAGTLLTALAVSALTVVLMFLIDATAFRRPSWPAAKPLVMFGGFGVALLNLVHEVVLVIEAHRFVSRGDLSSKAVEKALLTSGSLGIVLGLLGLFAALALAVGMIATMMGTMRAGLLARWLSVLGILSGLLFLPFFGTPTLQLIPTFWLVSTGILLMGRWPNGDPPAWAAGEARPWPTQAEQRAQREAEKGGGSGASPGKGSGNGAALGDVAPEPTPVSSGGSRRKRRKR